MFVWLRILWRRIIRHTPGSKFYITAFNTFDTGLSGNFPPPDAERVADHLTTLATLNFQHPPLLGFRTKYRGMAEALLMTATFWRQSSADCQVVAERRRSEVLRLLSHCVRLDVPVPLSLIWPNQQALLTSLEQEGIRTWQALLHHRLRDPEPPLFAQAMKALEQKDPSKLPSAVIIQYWVLEGLLGTYGVQTESKPLRRNHGTNSAPNPRTVTPA